MDKEKFYLIWNNMHNSSRIQLSPEFPSYWQYLGKPVVLLGGSVEDNLFQIDDLKNHLALLADCGGNYIRCTMSDRDPGNCRAFKQMPDGRYDLSQPGEEYWQRFADLLKWTEQYQIIVQIEVWDRFDHAQDFWQTDPYRPHNNINYTNEESGFAPEYPEHPGANRQPFFYTVPTLQNNTTVFKYQRQFVDRMLEHTLAYGHILYCMDNETNGSPAWGAYWAQYIRDKANAAGISVCLTEMWDAHFLGSPEHENTWKHPEMYDFCDISQNNHQCGQTHWENMLDFKNMMIASGRYWPINCVKTYGADGEHYGNDRDGQERFWRNLLGGLASTRFHRPPCGLGLNNKAQAHLRSARQFADKIDVIRCHPDNSLLMQRQDNLAYCTVDPGRVYAVFFPDGGQVDLNVSSATDKQLMVSWLDIMACTWTTPEPRLAADGRITLTTPGKKGYWAVVVESFDANISCETDTKIR